jgi:translation initiation factor 3 subunit I
LFFPSSFSASQLVDVKTLQPLKTYRTERPVNAATISPTHNHVIVGGGLEAMDVTNINTRIAKFEVRLFDVVQEDEIGNVKGHFGPVNALAFSPDGKG